jgi:hypothetical protein
MNGQLLSSLESVAVLRLGVVLSRTHDPGILQIWYHSIDIHFTLFHVKFKDGLSISGLKNKAARQQNLQLEILKSLKKAKFV